jgi:glycosyltransferase involved in cell wall biosynthesis
VRVVLLADRRFATRERSMLGRLQVGLADEGTRVVLALPKGFEEERDDLLHQTVHFDETGLPFTLSWRAGETARRLRELERPGSESARLVHVFGGALWPFGLALARSLGGVLIVEVWRAGLVRQAERLLARASGRAGVMILCPDEALARRFSPEARARVAPWGVHTGRSEPREPGPREAWSVMIAGGGIDRAAFTACFRAVAEVVRERPDMLVFVDALAARRADLWRLAEKLGIRPRVSLVDEMDANRELVLRGELLVLPEARGEQRTLVLEAMAVGMPVVAARDPANGVLIHERTALLVRPGDQPAWMRELKRLLSDPDAVSSLTASARQFVEEEHRPSRHVGAVLGCYEAALGDPPIPFPASRA